MRLSRRQTASVRPSLWLWICLVAVCFVVGPACWTGCQRSDGPPAPGSPPTGEPAAPAPFPPAPSGTGSTLPQFPATVAATQGTAQEVLEAMVKAYREASSYEDRGYLEIRYQSGMTPLGERADFRVALARPNKIRVQAYQGVVVSDAEKLWGVILNVPDQVLQVDAPAEVTVESLYPSHVLADAMSRGPTQTFSWLPLQLVLLLADDPLKTLLHGAEAPQLIEPAKLDEHDCDRVQIRRQDGTAVFWIDQTTRVLRRFELPTVALRMLISQGEGIPPEQIQGLALVAEFVGAQFGGEIDPKAFEFLAPPEVGRVEEFVPSAIRWLGQSVPEFSFVDLEGNRITRESLAGKTAVLDFWATWCDPCRATLPDLEQVYQKYKDNEQVTFLAVHVERPGVEVSDEEARATFRQLGVNVPIARDPEDLAARALQVLTVPTSLILDGEGVVQHRLNSALPPGVGAERLSANLNALLSGVDLAAKTRQEFEQGFQMQKKRFRSMLDQCVKNDLYVFTAPEIPRAEVVEQAEPKSLKLTELWSCTELAAPGNILVLQSPDQPPRLMVLESGEAVVEIHPQGNVVSVKPLSVPKWENPQGQMQQEPIFFLRSAVRPDGRRYFIGSAIGVQQVQVWDEGFNLLASFPEDALRNPHSGIADARIADFKGDGTLELAVSYLGVIGVQGASLEGKRLWANKSVVQSIRLGVLAPDDTGQRSLLCVNNANNTLAVLDPAGEAKAEFSVPNRAIAWLETADLDGDGQMEICGLTPVEEGHVEAIGLNLEGEELWSYRLPRGVHERQIEAVIAGRLFADQPGQWLLAAADGTIHILDAQGKLIDVFATGKPLAGVATAEWDGKRVLLVSSTPPSPGASATPSVQSGSVDAWQVEPLGSP